MKKKIPNILTSMRIVGAVLLLFTKLFSPAFFVLYTICGITDALDGYLARKWHCDGRLGAKLDNAADVMFYGAMLTHMIPYMWNRLPLLFWFHALLILLGRIAVYVISAVKYQRYAANHTYLNKLSGLTVFALPYVIHFTGSLVICNIVVGVALISCMEELILLLCMKEYDPRRKSIFSRPAKSAE